jgi:hypothetical protein
MKYSIAVLILFLLSCSSKKERAHVPVKNGEVNIAYDLKVMEILPLFLFMGGPSTKNIGNHRKNY